MTDGVAVKNLHEELASLIASQGPLRFRDFMELALYHPKWGYYLTADRSPGRSGDFFTSVSVGPLFGRLLAEWVAGVWRDAGCPPGFEILEQGAHHGQLARDLLEALQRSHPEAYQALHRYVMVEAAAATRPCPELPAPHRDKIHWMADLAPARSNDPRYRCFLANELLDAFPVHRVRWNGHAWRERRVTLTQAGLDWIDAGLGSRKLERYLQGIATEALEPGYTTEVNLDIEPWASRMTSAVPHGRALLIDYGFEQDTYYAPFRKDGTLQAYAAHRRSEHLLAQPGQQDLSAHVNLTQLRDTLADHGWTCLQTTDHHRFLTRLARPRLLDWEKDPASLQMPAGRQWLRQFHQLTHPSLMGQAFKVLEFDRSLSMEPLRNPVEPPAKLA